MKYAATWYFLHESVKDKGGLTKRCDLPLKHWHLGKGYSATDLRRATRYTRYLSCYRRAVIRIQLCKTLAKFLVQKLILSDRNLLEESILIAENLAEAEGYLARACFKLAQIYGQSGNAERQKHYMEEAQTIRKRICGKDTLPEASQEAYDNLVLWMLW